MDPELLKIALGGLVLLGCIGLFFGIGLAIAAHKFAVEANPLIEKVLFKRLIFVVLKTAIHTSIYLIKIIPR